jgi:amidase
MAKPGKSFRLRNCFGCRPMGGYDEPTATPATPLRGCRRTLGLIRHLRKARSEGFDVALRTKQFMIAAEIVHQEHGIAPYAFSRNAAAVLRKEYDAALDVVDVLAMPTTPHTAPLLPSDPTLKAGNFAAESMASNTVPFNMTHHPALTIPCGRINGMPVGLMLVGRHGQEDLLYRIAAAVERQTA